MVPSRLVDANPLFNGLEIDGTGIRPIIGRLQSSYLGMDPPSLSVDILVQSESGNSALFYISVNCSVDFRIFTINEVS